MRWFAALAIFAVTASADGQESAAAAQLDAAATRLLAEARAARALWQNFPGFTADLEVYCDGKTSKGHVQVSAGGQVSLKLDDPAIEPWARHTLGSTVSHRLANGSAPRTPASFLDNEIDHPRGRAIRVLGDELHSSYRIHERQIVEVNRNMGDVYFTISVMENRWNEEDKCLPVHYVVNSWDAKTNALKSSETHYQTWQRVGKFDLPLTASFAKASANRLDTRRIKLTNHKLD